MLPYELSGLNRSLLVKPNTKGRIQMKKVLLVVLVLIAVLSLSTAAFAAGGNGGVGGDRQVLSNGTRANSEACPYYPDCPRDGNCSRGYDCPYHEDCPRDATCDYYTTGVQTACPHGGVQALDGTGCKHNGYHGRHR